MNYSKLNRIEKEIRQLLIHRLSLNPTLVLVETYYGMDEIANCRIELFEDKKDIKKRKAKYEAPLIEGFYFEAECSLKKQLKKERNCKIQFEDT